MNVCLVGVAHVSNNPRLVREADALVEAGHTVRVVAPSYLEEAHVADQWLAKDRGWHLQTVDWRRHGPGGSRRSVYVRARRRLAFEAYQRGARNRRVGLLAYSPALPELTRLAMSRPADWFIAHAHGSLPAAAHAARHFRATLGFDCEDYLADSNAGDPPDLVRLIERTYLEECRYISAPTNALARTLVDVYGNLPTLVLYNVPPVAASSQLAEPRQRPIGSILRLHWVSQTIGPNRGIEDAIAALGRVRGPAELHLRGTVPSDYKRAVLALADQHGVSGRVLFLDRVPPHDVVAAMGAFDVGLALEPSTSVNSDRTASNKIFAYMMAGLAIVATDTTGQREVMSAAGNVGFHIREGDAEALASCLQDWIDDKAALRHAQQAAWDAGHSRFCWDVEKLKYLEVVEGRASPAVQEPHVEGAV